MNWCVWNSFRRVSWPRFRIMPNGSDWIFRMESGRVMYQSACKDDIHRVAEEFLVRTGGTLKVYGTDGLCSALASYPTPPEAAGAP